ncbi:hypothetical protein [Nocardia ninae]|nr:hypothetical protein [Nocardia ninae]
MDESYLRFDRVTDTDVVTLLGRHASTPLAPARIRLAGTGNGGG